MERALSVLRWLAALAFLAAPALAQTIPTYGPLQAQNGLSELAPNPAPALNNLGIGGLGTKSAGSVSIQWTGGSSNTVVGDTYYLMPAAPWGGTIASINYLTGGTGTPSFTFSLRINGVNVTGCTGIVVHLATMTTSTCTAANTFAAGQAVTLVVSSVVGVPFDAVANVNYLVAR